LAIDTHPWIDLLQVDIIKEAKAPETGACQKNIEKTFQLKILWYNRKRFEK
jgi:hypothetical protein